MRWWSSLRSFQIPWGTKNTTYRSLQFMYTMLSTRWIFCESINENERHHEMLEETPVGTLLTQVPTSIIQIHRTLTKLKTKKASTKKESTHYFKFQELLRWKTMYVHIITSALASGMCYKICCSKGVVYNLQRMSQTAGNKNVDVFYFWR